MILYTNDEHGWMSDSYYSRGAAQLMGLWCEKEQYTDEGPYIILSGGDNWTGPAISTWFKGESMVEVMNTMGYTASAIGNHEFDFTVDELRKRISEANFSYLSANIREKTSGQIPDFARPYLIKTVNDVRIGIIGLTTTSTSWSTFPDFVRQYEFIPYARALNHTVPEIKEKGAQLIIIIGHVCRNELEQLAPIARELGIAALFGGHCHQLYSEMFEGVAIMEGGSFMAGYAKAEIWYDATAGTVSEINLSTHRNEGGNVDRNVAEVVDRWESKMDSTLSDVIGFSAAEIERNSPEMANMITDSWLFAFPQADVALTNRGGIRQSIPPGNVTLKTIVGLLPFENSILELKLTGSQLIDCIDRLEMGGMTTVNGYYLADGAPVHPDSVYTILTTDYLYARDDHNFSKYDPNPYNTGVHFRQPLIDWLKSLHTSEQSPLNQYLVFTPRR